MPTAELMSGPAIPRGHGIHRVVRGVLANFLGQAIQASGQVLLIPIYLAVWGNQLYGEWLMLSAALTHLTMIDFGMQMFVVNRLTQSHARQDPAAYRRVFQSALLLSAMASGVALLAVVPALTVAPFQSWLHFSATARWTAVAVGVVLAFQVLGAVPYGLLAGAYRSVREYPRGQMVENIKLLLMFGASAAVLAAGGKLLGVALAQLGALAGTFLYVARDLRLRHPEAGLGFAKSDLRLAVSFIGPSSLFFLMQMANAITVQGSVLVAGALFGAASVATLVPLRTLANLFRQAGGALHSALWPELTSMEADGEHARLREVHLLVAKLLVLISVSSAVFLHFAAADIVSVWTRNRISFRPELMDALLGLLISQAPWTTAATLLAASNNHRILAVCSLASSAGGLGLGYALSGRFGLAGFVHGIWVADFLICGWLIPRAACRLIGQGFLEFLAQVPLRGLALGVALYVAVAAALPWLSSFGPVVRLPAIALATGAGALILAYLLFLNRRERESLRALLRQGSLRLASVVLNG